ncbi:MAG: LytTR family DNA-binding domain-containing protein [Roseivirga sp.]
MIQCCVVDDEPLARECLINYIEEIDFLELAGTCNNPMELDKVLSKQRIDLIFLDIQMPMMNGIDFLKSNRSLPPVIFTTAYPSYALEGYQLDVLDYLLKPITLDRFYQAAVKARDYLVLVADKAEKVATDDYFFVKCDSKYEKIFLDQVLFIQAQQNYIVIHTQQEKYMTLLNLKSVSENLNPDHFVKTHKSFIVAKKHVQSIDNSEALIGKHRIPISRTYREEAMQKLLGERLWKR